MNGAAARIRPEIQSLRAIAVAVVVTYHFWPRLLPGGFIGVDVFFVISGYLITAQLLREIDRTGWISMSGFWARRARRILPPALFVLLFCAVATIVFVPLNYWQQFFAEVRASTTYEQNWHLAAAAVNYFSANDPPSPVQHFWSLSAEEQFYIVWPLVILLAAGAARVARLRATKRTIAVVLGGLTLASLAYGVYWTGADPAAAYFVTPTRAWEFGVGGLLALFLGNLDSPRRSAAALTWVGLAAIAIAAATFSDSTAFPGVAAMLPVAGALLVIHAGGREARLSPAPLLRLKPFQFLGDISYSVYLWHLPLLVLAPFVLHSRIDSEGRLVIAMFTIIAAWLTKLAIEDPVRRGPLLTTRRARWTFTAAATGTAVVFAVSAWGTSYVHAQIRADDRVADRVVASAPRCFGAAARDPEHPCENPNLRLSVVPTPVAAHDRPNAPCKITSTKPFTICEFGVPRRKARATIALVGDSHASHWRAALAVVARDNRWHGLSITRSGCPFSTTVRKLRNPLEGECIQWNRTLPKWFAAHPRVSTIFVVQDTGAKWVVPHGQNPFQAQVAGFTRAWHGLPRSVRHVVVIRDTPKDRLTTAACVERAMAARREAGQACKVPRREAIDRDAQALAAQRFGSPRVATVDLTRFFCDRRWCYPVIGGALVHKDDHHMTVVFATTLGPYLERALQRVLPGQMPA
jgi:peptidoglycan/LPS O-acetylase OafA/YrhL